jgi:hypothetical protein
MILRFPLFVPFVSFCKTQIPGFVVSFSRFPQFTPGKFVKIGAIRVKNPCPSALSAKSAVKFFACFAFFAAMSLPAQSNSVTASLRHEQDVRAACIEGRRLICGKILEILPAGLIVESGYTNLLREPLSRSWLIPGTAEASRRGDPTLAEVQAKADDVDDDDDDVNEGQ